MQNSVDTYIADADYHALKNALVQMVAQPFDRAGTDAETEVVRALGEIGGVWPESAKS